MLTFMAICKNRQKFLINDVLAILRVKCADFEQSKLKHAMNGETNIIVHTNVCRYLKTFDQLSNGQLS